MMQHGFDGKMAAHAADELGATETLEKINSIQ